MSIGVVTGLPALSSTRTRIPRPTASPQSGTWRSTVRLPTGTPSKGRLSRRVRVPVTLRAGAVGRKVTGSDRLVPCAKRSGGIEAPGPEKAGLPVKPTRSAISSAWPVLVNTSVCVEPQKIPQLGS